MSFRALNDGESLNLLVTSLNRDGRALLTGVFRQDFTLWFLKPDGKTRLWGLRLPFGSLDTSPGVSWEDVRHPDEAVPPQTAALEIAAPLASGVSTATLSGEVTYSADIAAHEPFHLFRVPLKELARRGSSIRFEFESSSPSLEVQRQFAERRAQGPAPSAWKRPPQNSPKAKTWITVTTPAIDPVYPDRIISHPAPRFREEAENGTPREMLLPNPLLLRFSIKLAHKPLEGRDSVH